MQHLGSKVLQTPRLILRPFCVEDAQQAFENWMSDPVVTKFLTWSPHTDVGSVRELLALWQEEAARKDCYHWAVVLKESGEVVGDLSVVTFDEENESVKTGYCLARKAWGGGLMTEAYARVLAFLFEEVGVHRVAATHAVDNPASGRVMEKCGLRCEGRARGEVKLRSTGEWTDVMHYGMTREDYFARK